MLVSKATVEVAILVAFWYATASLSVISSKSAMNLCPTPFVLCLMQFLIASLICVSVYFFQARQKKIDFHGSLMKVTPTLIVVAVCYTAGFLLTNIAFSLGNPSSVETIKASEPVSSVLLGQLFYPESVSFLTYVSLVPIIFGVGMSCIGDSASFPFWCSLFALLSNLGFSGRAVAAKVLQKEHAAHGESADELLMFAQISCIGVCIILPFAFYFDYDVMSVYMNSNASGGIIGADLIQIWLFNGVFYTIYNLTSFLVLTRTNVVTHAVLNACRRVVIIAATSFYFETPLSSKIMIGVTIALIGVVCFGISKNLNRKSSSNGTGTTSSLALSGNSTVTAMLPAKV